MASRNRSGKRPKKHRTTMPAPKPPTAPPLPTAPPEEAILVCEEAHWDPIDDAALVLGWDDEYAVPPPPDGPMRDAVVATLMALVLIAVAVTAVAMFGGAS